MDGKNAAYFERLRCDRLESMPKWAETDEAHFHEGTERLLINFAFDRIHEGDYWYCVKCGKDIPEKRLLADPTTLLCTKCTPRRQE